MTKPVKNAIALDLRVEEGREIVTMELAYVTTVERQWLFDQLASVKEGRSIEFGVDSTPAGELVIKFTLGQPEPKHADTDTDQAGQRQAA